MTQSTLQKKFNALKNELQTYDHLAIAFSGGVDSAFLALAAHSAIGIHALAVTCAGSYFPPDEIERARDFCTRHDIPHLVLNIDDEITDQFAYNPPDRCYLCKKCLFSMMKDALGDIPIADGSNLDDLGDYRPGRIALRELEVISPLIDTGFTKHDIRSGLAAMNEPIWDEPACACLASRIPYGSLITKEKLDAVYKAESALREMGFRQVRVRHHETVARIEVPKEDIPRFFDMDVMKKVNEAVRDAGFTHVALDLAGYEKGSLNRDITL